MARQYYKDSTTGQMKPLGVKVEDTLPVGTEVDYDGTDIPEGWVEIDDPNTYSTDEVRIGTWIDGKPLYRKSYNFGSLPNNSSKSMNLGIDNLGLITNINAIAKNTGGTVIPIPTISTSSSGLITLYISGNTLYITTGEDRTAYNCYITVEYTKTTD